MPPKLSFSANDPKVMDKWRDYFRGVEQALMKAGDKLPKEIEGVSQNVKSILDYLNNPPAEANQQAAWAFECMANVALNLEDARTKSIGALETLRADHEKIAQELSALKTRVEAKELVEKEAADKAVQDAVKAERDRVALFSARRGELMKANLPAPAGDELLEGDEKAWGERFGEAKKRAEKLKGFSKFEAMSADLKVKLLLGEKDRYDMVETLAQELSGRSGGAAGDVEPLAGGAGGGGGAGEDKDKGGEGKTKRRFAV